jgi:FMN-dependent oxidoreductase (nitrilotriacetate monooxygenase family)
MDHEERYDRGEEYAEVVYKLLEHSWEDDAVVKDAEQDVWTDSDKVHEINHDGKYHTVQGPHLVEPSPQRTPVLYQAGQSDRGRDFAAKHAEAVFCAQPTISAAKEYVDDIRQRVEEYGRDPERVAIINILAPIVGVTEKAAQEKADELLNVHSPEGVKAGVGGWWDVDLSEYDMDDNIEHVDSMAIQGLVNAFTKDEAGKEWTVEEFLEHMSLGSFAPTVVGSPEQIADEMERWVDEAGVDGFNIMPIHKPGVYRDVVDLVVPELQRRNIYKEEYGEGKTLRKRMFEDSDRLPDEHIAHSYTI